MSQQRISLLPSSMRTYSLRLQPGADLKKQLSTVVHQEHIEAGVVLTCVGSLTEVALRLANQTEPSEWKGYYEIISLVGTLSMDGVHLHVSVSDSTGRVIGGHLLDGCKIYTTAELVVGILTDVIYTREPDSTYGYRELVIRTKDENKKGNV